MVSEQERRKSARSRFNWPIKIQSAQGPIEGELENIGAGGAFIDCDPTLEPGDHLSLMIFIPDHSPLEITAEVVWTCMFLPHGIGVRFVKISQADREFLSKAISKIPKLKSDEDSMLEF